jgi:hypothetical protein
MQGRVVAGVCSKQTLGGRGDYSQFDNTDREQRNLSSSRYHPRATLFDLLTSQRLSTVPGA